MAEATQEGQVHQSEQLDSLKQQLGKDLTSVIQQLMLTNASDSTFKDEFKDANSKILQQVLEGNKLGKEAILGDNKGEVKEESRWGKLLGHFGWAKKFAERGAKLAKLGKDSAVKFGKSKLASVTKFAGNMLDLLLKGLGLFVLWKLFDWLSNNDWEEITAKVKGWVEKIGLSWETLKTTLTGISEALVKWDGAVGGIATIVKGWPLISWVADFSKSSLSLVWTTVKTIFGATGMIWKWSTTVMKWTETLMFGENGALAKLWKGIKAVFGPISPMKTSAINVEGWKESNMFRKEGALAKLMKNIRSVFGIEGVIAQFLTKGGNWNPLNWFGDEGGVTKLFRRIRGAFAPTGSIGGFMSKWGKWNPLEWFGEQGAIGKLFSKIGGAFGPEGTFGGIGNWFAEKWKSVKNFFTVGKDGGPLTKLMTMISNVTSGIGGAWESMKSAKWFTSLKSVFTAVKGFASAIMVPLRFILLPLTWILGIGAAVMGFVNGFRSKEGIKDERSFTDKIIDGLRGAFKGLIDFFVIDLVVMAQDLLNWIIGKVNKIATWIPGFDGFDKVTFGTDLANWSTEAMGFNEGAMAAEKMKGPIDIDKVLRDAGGKLEDKEGWNTGDKFEIGIDKFGAAIDKLDLEGLQAMANKMDEMRKDKSIEFVNEGGIGQRLKAEIKERTDQLAEQKRIEEVLKNADLTGGQGGGPTTNITANSSKSHQGVIMGSKSENPNVDMLRAGS